MYYVSRICGALAILSLLIAGWFSVRLALADAKFREATPESVARAAELQPRNTAYLALHALQLDYAGENPAPLLEKIVELTPYASAPRIRLGLAAEERGDFTTAEKWLLDAAGIDRQFEPRWTLANYYFRRQNTQEFWKWIRLALEVSYGDRHPAFDLCWRASDDPAEILTRAIPDRHEVLAAYLGYLLETRAIAAPPAAIKLAALNDPADRDLLFSACDSFLAAGDSASAQALWRALGYPAPAGVTSPNFEPPRAGHGFDWRFIESNGVIHVTLDTPAAHRISFNGQQPESCELLRQVLILRAGGRYILHWEARTQGLPASTGVEWRIGDQRAAIAPQQDWKSGEHSFTAAAALPILSLAYQRPTGEPRAEGWIELRRVTVTESSK